MTVDSENKHKIQIANILLTRRCNLRCDYCYLVQDYLGKPKEYPDMKYYRDNEKTALEWIEAFDLMYQNNPDIFFILYGGEPFLYPGLAEIIKHFKDYSYNHTIISNNTPVIQPKIMDLYNKVGKLPGFTASIDPELCLYLEKQGTRDDDAIRKTIAGFTNLRILKDKGIAQDVVAEITCSSSNLQYLYKTVEILSSYGIYSSITTLDIQKSSYYDFSAIRDSSLCVNPDLKTRVVFDQILSNPKLLVHMPQLLNSLFDVLPFNMKCDIHKDIHNVSIDSDLTFRLCLRCKGIEVAKIPVVKGILPNGNISQILIDAFKVDYNKLCLGCNHTCLLMSKHYANQIISH